MKCSAIKVNGEWRDVYKDHITDTGKRSKKGRLALIHEHGKYETVPLDGYGYADIMQTVYSNGDLFNETTFEQVRERSNKI